MHVFHHLIYEYKKGIRSMMLCTLTADMEEKVRRKLDKNGIDYRIQRLKNGNINVFFGKQECILVANKICGDKALNLLTPEEDFILGILLGYSISEQCNRYFRKEQKENSFCLT